MKVLTLSPVPPCPPDRGSKIRVYHAVNRLLRRHTVRGLSLSDPTTRRPSEPQKNGKKSPVCGSVESKGSPRGTFASAAHSIIGYTTYRGAKFDGAAFRTRLQEVVTTEEFDLIWIHFLNMMRFFRDGDLWSEVRNVPIVLDQHNDVERVWQRNRERGGIAKRLFARWNIARIRDLRAWALPRCDLILSVSEEDARATRSKVEGDTPVWVAPNGVELDHFDARAGSDSEMDSPPKRLLFVGSMDVTMNVEAVDWFVREIFPQLRRNTPDIEFQIVGRNPASEVRALGREEGVEVTGGVASVKPYYEQAAVAVVPLLRGGGTKLKVPEAMAAQVPIVSTSVGAQGLDVKDSVHLRIADQANAFVEAVEGLLTDRSEARRLVRAAYNRVKQQYSWSGIYDGVIQRLEERLSRSTARL